MTENRLHLETSPYLLQHEHNPVNWYPWGDLALQTAKAQNKPILLSIGYSACHWCHVMAHESFENEAIAEVMNKHFINVKVDREERPDLDALYQSALQTLNQRGGWPLTMMLTPKGEPFWGGTYFPSEPRYGFPGFKDILQRISTAWQDDKSNILQNVKKIAHALDLNAGIQNYAELSLQTLEEAANLILSRCDPTYGSFLGAPKFPQVPILQFLWQFGQAHEHTPSLDQVTLTLTNMIHGGIYDHLGGGFARYATDENWLVPHFEKMLYDNALLVDLLCDVFKTTPSDVYKTAISETLNWVLRDLKITDSSDGFAFATALDADSEGEEGLYYVWTEDQIDAVLGKDAALFKKTYDVTEHGNWDEGPLQDDQSANILHRPQPNNPVNANLQTARKKLLAQRDLRIPPGRDHKVLAELNGMMIKALVQAGLLFENPVWIKAAKSAFQFICKNLNANQRLKRSWAKNQAKHAATLDDLAHMSAAALSLYEATAVEAYLDQAELWVAEIIEYFSAEDQGAYYLSASDVTDLYKRSRQISDHATPSGNGVFALVLVRLFLITGQDDYRSQAERLIGSTTSNEAKDMAHCPGLLKAYDFLLQSRQIVIVGEGPWKQDLVHAAYSSARTAHVVLYPRAHTAPHSPASAKEPINGQPTAYVCTKGTCAAPVISTRDLKELLEKS